MNDVLHATLVDAVRWLKGEELPYALIGGIAVSVRGQPRTTADVDLVIAADVPRALQLLEKLPESPFRPLFDGAEDLILMKLLAGRAQDTQDVRGIVAARQDDLDWDYCLSVAAELEEAIEQNLVAQVHKLRDGA